MQATLVYTFAYGSTILLLLCWRLSQFLTIRVRQRIISIFLKWFVYTVVSPRLNGSSDITVLSALLIIIILTGNIFASTLALEDQNDLASRLARLSSINMVFLYLGGRTNIIVDKVFRLSYTEYWLLHRWLGRIAAAEGIVHAAVKLANHRSTPAALNLSLLALLSSIALLSVIFIRRKVYELFLQTHHLFSVAILILVWLHVRQLNTFLLSCFTIAASLLLVQNILWVIFTFQGNYGRSIRHMSVTRFPRSGLHKPVIQVRLDIKKPWPVKPGKYIYLTLPRLRSLGLGIVESHPFMIAWAVENEQIRSRSIVLLVQVRGGFTQKLQFANPLSPVIIGGPYGGNEADAMANYDKILLMSSGIGVASHLDTARYLLLAHDRQTARVRRLTMVWLLETQDDFQWAEELLCQLHDMDKRKILNIHTYYPDETDRPTGGLKSQSEAPRERIFPTPAPVDSQWVLQKEWRGEAGNMLVLGELSPPRGKTIANKSGSLRHSAF
ncbi:uncharacterized protein EKO05_0005349 [Ascochyta rabiei]|uniref:uncharacterized protein n=1 Tax=Didymella rabiei TaxID=5454 RepID=UPI0022023DF7|nr:uncharacterized protein EKO05_0005349 [Ascochyta rabiei]UPX14878.1 hypothetical protein EKO05_0005349 [Ascochyta rabiei]